jgi:hypothetical protein
MIIEDVTNFQRQLEHLFRTFEVDASVSCGLIGKEDWGVTVISTNPEFKAIYAGDSPVAKRKAKKKDALSG